MTVQKLTEPKPQPKSNGKKKPIELSEDKILDTKFTLSVQTMVGMEWDYAFFDWNVVYFTR